MESQQPDSWALYAEYSLITGIGLSARSDKERSDASVIPPGVIPEFMPLLGFRIISWEPEASHS